MILGFVQNREAIVQLRVIEINASNTAPLVGMTLLEGFKLRVQAYEGGSVAILPIA